jgi:hypothetical protein
MGGREQLATAKLCDLRLRLPLTDARPALSALPGCARMLSLTRGLFDRGVLRSDLFTTGKPSLSTSQRNSRLAFEPRLAIDNRVLG